MVKDAMLGKYFSHQLTALTPTQPVHSQKSMILLGKNYLIYLRKLMLYAL